MEVYVLQWYEKVNNDDLRKQDESNKNDHLDDVEVIESEDQPVIVDHTIHIESENDVDSDDQFNINSEMSYNEPSLELNHGQRVKELYIQWLELLLYDQTSLSQLLQAEALHIQVFLSEERQFSSYPTRQDIVAFQETVGKVIDSINEKQRIHIKLLDSSIKLFQQSERAE